MSRKAIPKTISEVDLNSSDSEAEELLSNDDELLGEPDEPAEPEEEYSDTESEEDEDVLYSLAEPESYLSKDGNLEWEPYPLDTGKTRTCDKVLALPGPKAHLVTCIKNIRDPFDCLFSDSMKAIVLIHTNAEGKQRYGDAWKTTDSVELDAYFGLLYLHGVNRESKTASAELWHQIRGRPLYGATMSRKRFVEISTALRFDDKLTREERRAKDRMCHIRELWDSWVANLKNSFNPGFYTTVDEQLYPFRGRCSFKMFIKSKPAKYGLKFWVLVDVKSGYVLNIQLYTGKPPGGAPEKNQGRRVVLDLVEHLRSTSGINVTCDNFFTDVKLGEELLKRNMTMVGTFRKNKPEIPRQFLPCRARELNSTLFGFTRSFTLASYVPKIGKAVILLSSFHHDAAISDGEQLKPEIILDYNATKAGVDTMDQMIGTYTVHRKTCRWPMAVLHDMIDITGINAMVIWNALNPEWSKNRKHCRRLFITELGESLIRPHLERKLSTANRTVKLLIQKILGIKTDITGVDSTAQTKRGKRKACLYCPSKINRKSTILCVRCGNNVCGEHSGAICFDCNGN